MKKKVLSVLLAAAMAMSMLTVFIILMPYFL